MTVLIGQHEFEGPVTNFANIPSLPGVYAFLFEESHGLMLIDIYESGNLAITFAKSTSVLGTKILVFLICETRERCKAILAEISQEFPYDDGEILQNVPNKRTETNAGVSFSI